MRRADSRRLVRCRRHVRPVRGQQGNMEKTEARTRPSSLVMGPWPHGGWGSGDFRPLRRRSIRPENGRVLPRQHPASVLQPLSAWTTLRGRARAALRPQARHSPALRYSTDGREPAGSPSISGRPKTITEPLWRCTMNANHQITLNAPATAPTATTGKAFDEWTSDPANPVPYIKRGARTGARTSI